MSDCIFCKIANKEIPSFIVYEDEYALAFLDINPQTIGHTVVIPKKHIENIFDINDEDMINFSKSIPKVAKLLKSKLDPIGINILNNNLKPDQEVMHLHFHLIPRYENDDFKIKFNNHNNTSIKDVENIYKKITDQ